MIDYISDGMEEEHVIGYMTNEAKELTVENITSVFAKK